MIPKYLLNDKDELIDLLLNKLVSRKVLFYLMSLSGTFFASILLNKIYRKIRREIVRYREGTVKMVMTDDLTCIICMENPRNIIIKQCKHMVMCGICFDKLRKDECPVCKAVIEDHIKVYFS
jgi:E3 ubiquitin-protein ligase MUL1